jgi:hypothetical protein
MGLLDIKVGDFSRKEDDHKDNLGNLLEINIIAVYTVQAKYARRLPIPRLRKPTKSPKTTKGLRPVKYSLNTLTKTRMIIILIIFLILLLVRKTGRKKF